MAIQFSIFLLRIFCFLLKLLYLVTMHMTMLVLLLLQKVNIVINKLRHDLVISDCFDENYMTLDSDKCHFLTLSFTDPFPYMSLINQREKMVNLFIKSKFSNCSLISLILIVEI